MKAIVVAFVLLVPVEVYVIPDVLAAQQATLYTLTNDVRIANGIVPLTQAPQLYASSQHKATDMANKAYFAHIGPDGTGLASWLDDADYAYSTAGENLAIGFSDPRVLVNAWVNSPTHLANLIDPDYEETGIGLAAGMYDGVPVVYVAQHFGTEKNGSEIQIAVQAPIESQDSSPVVIEENTTETVIVSSTTFGDVLGTKEEQLKPTLIDEGPALVDPAGVLTQTSENDLPQSEQLGDTSPIDQTRSFARYENIDDTQFRIVAYASINIPFRSATVMIGGDIIPLTKETGSYGVRTGSLIIEQPVSEYFKAVLVPELRITLADGSVMSEALRWQHVPKVGLTPVEQYTASKSMLSSITNLFNVTNGIFFFFIGFFTIALLLNIFWEIKYQHHHVTVQTLGLILLLITLVAI